MAANRNMTVFINMDVIAKIRVDFVWHGRAYTKMNFCSLKSQFCSLKSQLCGSMHPRMHYLDTNPSLRCRTISGFEWPAQEASRACIYLLFGYYIGSKMAENVQYYVSSKER